MLPALFLFFVSTACYVPVLTTPASEQETEEWETPENDWPYNQPPSDLEEEGFDTDNVVLNLDLVDQNGDEVKLWQFYDMVLLVDVSSEWCAPCRQLALEVEETYEDYKEEGFMYLTILGEDNNAEIPSQPVLKKWADDHEIHTAPVTATTTDLRSVLIPDGSYPRVFLVGRNLKVINPKIDPANDANIRAEVEKAL